MESRQYQLQTAQTARKFYIIIGRSIFSEALHLSPF